MATVGTVAGSSLSSEKVPGKQWVVVKFGGTSVSYGDTWQQIVTRVKELQNGPDGSSYNVLLVLSALTQVPKQINLFKDKSHATALKTG